MQDCNRDSGVTLLFFFVLLAQRLVDFGEFGESLVMLMSDICSIKKLVANGIN